MQGLGEISPETAFYSTLTARAWFFSFWQPSDNQGRQKLGFGYNSSMLVNPRSSDGSAAFS
jgi:hypothetical protein